MPESGQKAIVSAQASLQGQVRELLYNVIDSNSRAKRKMKLFLVSSSTHSIKLYI